MRGDVYKRQVYLVCPAIEDVPDGGLNAVKTYYEDIAKTLLPSLAYLTGVVLLVAAAGYAVDAVYQRLYRCLLYTSRCV